MEKYIGLDVHATSCTAAVIDAQGKKLGSHVIETSGQSLRIATVRYSTAPFGRRPSSKLMPASRASHLA